MSFILVIEPDTAQTELLQTIIAERVGAEQEFVTSAAAAMMAVSRRAPDLLLFGRTVSSLDQIVIVDYARSLTQAAEVFALTVPELRTGEEPAAPPSGWFRLGKPSAEQSGKWDPILFAEQIASTLARAEESARADNERQVPDAECRGAAADDAQPSDEPLGANRESELEIERARADAAERRMQELVLLQQEAEAAREAAVAQARLEVEARLASELARARDEAERTRQTCEQAQREADASRIAAAEAARAASEEGARALQREVARVRAEAETRLESELSRVRREAEEARVAEEQAQPQADIRRMAADEAAHALRIEIARVRAEAQARLEQELVRVREEAERARIVESDAQREAEIQRDAAAAEARTAAEEASRILQREVARAKAETEERFEAELARVRGEADRARRANQEARLEMQLLREQAVRGDEARDRTLFEPRGRAPWAEGRGESSTRFLASWGTDDAPRPARARPHAALPAAAAMVVLAVAGSLAFYLPRVSPPARAGAPSEAPTSTTTGNSPARDAGRPPVRRTPRALPAAAATEPAATARGNDARTPGFIAVFSRIPLDLYLENRRLGSTDDGQLMLPAGRHRIRLVNERFRFHDEIEVDVRPGDVTSHTVKLPTAAVRIDTVAGAEVRVEGESVGTAPLGELHVPIGTREIVVTHPQMGERRQAVEVIYGETAEITIAFAETPVPAGPPRLAPLSAPQP